MVRNSEGKVGNKTQLVVGLEPGEIAIPHFFTALIGSHLTIFQWQGWHGDDQWLKSFQSIPCLADEVAGNVRYGRVSFLDTGRVWFNSSLFLPLVQFLSFLYFFKGQVKLGQNGRMWLQIVQLEKEIHI